jgi:Mg-chelatase subunit ChlD
LHISSNDLKYALCNGGNVSSYTDIYAQALGRTPIPVISRYDSPIILPSPKMLVEQTNPNLAALLSSYQKGIASLITDSALEIRFFSVPDDDKPVAELTKVIDEFNPNLIALSCSPCELSILIVYTFSMACALGLGTQFEVSGNLSVNSFFNRLIQPGSSGEVAVISSWLRHVPLLPLGRPNQINHVNHADYAEEARYVASRLIDIAACSSVLNKESRILVIVKQKNGHETEEIFKSYRKNSDTGFYLPQNNDVFYDRAIVTGKIIETQDNNQTLEIKEYSLAQQRFLNEFNKKITILNTASLLPEETETVITEIVHRLRNHPEVNHGPSVRGTLAFHEILNSLANLKGALTRECIVKAALISLVPRISVKRDGMEIEMVSEVVKEVLYGFRFREETGNRLDPESLKNSDLSDRKSQISSEQITDPEKSQNQSFVVIPPDPNKPPTSGIRSEKRLSEIDPSQQYLAQKQEILSKIHELDELYRAGKISAADCEQGKQALMNSLKDKVKSQLNHSEQETANTLMEMMDAKDKVWEKEISFNRMYIYYHVKGTSEKANISPLKQDYHALRWIIEDLEKQEILRTDDENSGFSLTGYALDMLLNHLVDTDMPLSNKDNFQVLGKSLTNFPSHDIRRFSSGDTFRNISIRHTLKEIARKKKTLSEVRYSDLKVFLRVRSQPQADIVFCIDTSGSMGFSQRLIYARLAAAGLARAAFRNGNRVGIVAFNDYGQSTVRITDKDRDSIMNGIASLSANGNTNIGDGLKSARELFSHNRSRNRKIIILLTDGQASAISKVAYDNLQSVAEQDLTQESAYLEARKAAAADIQLSVVYFTPNNEMAEQFIRTIARIGKGKIHRVTGLSDLKTMLRN